MKISRRGKLARRGKHTKRAGKHLRYKTKSKKFRASKRYHRGRGRVRVRTHKRGKRFHNGGAVTFQDIIAAQDPSNSSITNYTVQGTIDTIKYKKTSGLSITSGESPFQIEIKSTNNGLTANGRNYPSQLVVNIIFKRLNPPEVIYTMRSSKLDNIVTSINDGSNETVEGINQVDHVTANYNFSFKENTENFKSIQEKVEEIEDKILKDFTDKMAKKKSDTDTKVRNIKKQLEEKIKNEKELKINIGEGYEKEYRNYNDEIARLQGMVNTFIQNNPDSDKNTRLTTIMTSISQSLLELLVEAYFYQNYDLDGNELTKKEPNITIQLSTKTSYFPLRSELYKIVNPPPVNDGSEFYAGHPNL
jgi:Skp family chaperone for outer membrane proteins